MPRTAALVLLCLAALVAFPVSAAITDVPPGGTVFIGERGLNIAATNVTAGSQIARFTGGNVQTDAPSDVVTVSDPTSFYVSPDQFGSATGAWYTNPGRQLAFIVKDPSLQLRVINGRTGREIGSGAVSGDPLGFRIETNLDAMAQRPGVAGAPMTIHVRDPTGAEFTSLVNGGITTSLVNIPVNASVYETGPVWATDTSQYRAGSYEVWADCNANGMKDNYNQVGKTTTRSQAGISVQVGGTSGPSITGAATPTVTATGTTVATVTAVTTTANATAVSTPAPTATGTAVATASATATTATTAPATTRSPGFAATTLALAGIAALGLALFRRR
ncbi:MAG TPA: DUF3821 domain-containing protein [Methanoregulaceae archaeon]|nr:DUF3821 domain-containing protein [Methanoregulaceae archaeon]